MISRIALTVALSVLTLTSSSCSFLFREEWIDPVYSLEDARIIVVPFSKGDEYWYYEYSEGELLAQQVAQQIQQGECSGVTIITGPDVEKAIRTTFDEPMPWDKIAKQFKATHIVFGDVQDLSSLDSKRVGMLTGRLAFTFSIFSLEEGQVVSQHPVEERYPGNVDSEQVIISFTQNLPALRSKLFQRGAKEVSNYVCGFYRDKMENN